jgi:hypothetical protein
MTVPDHMFVSFKKELAPTEVSTPGNEISSSASDPARSWCSTSARTQITLMTRLAGKTAGETVAAMMTV